MKGMLSKYIWFSIWRGRYDLFWFHQPWLDISDTRPTQGAVVQTSSKGQDGNDIDDVGGDIQNDII